MVRHLLSHNCWQQAQFNEPIVSQSLVNLATICISMDKKIVRQQVPHLPLNSKQIPDSCQHKKGASWDAPLL